MNRPLGGGAFPVRLFADRHPSQSEWICYPDPEIILGAEEEILRKPPSGNGSNGTTMTELVCASSILLPARRSLRLPRFGVMRTRPEAEESRSFSRLLSLTRFLLRLPIGDSIVCYPSLINETGLHQIDLSENSQRKAHQQNHKHRTKPYACATACAPPSVPVVSSAQAEYQHKNKDEYEHFCCSPLSELQPGCMTALNPPSFPTRNACGRARLLLRKWSARSGMADDLSIPPQPPATPAVSTVLKWLSDS